MIVYAADLGSIKKGNFAWARAGSDGEVAGSAAVHDLPASISDDLNRGAKVALGFEAPMFWPLRSDSLALESARLGEGDRAWCAGAGRTATFFALSQVPWILSRVRTRVPAQVCGTLRWPEFVERAPNLFVWEAFVTKSAKGSSHIEDAKITTIAFLKAVQRGEPASSINEKDVFSFLGCALIRSGWANDAHMVSEPCLVIRA
jgi:hypothetical protein